MSNKRKNDKIARYRVDCCDDFDGTHYSSYYYTKEDARKVSDRVNGTWSYVRAVIDLEEQEITQLKNKFKEKSIIQNSKFLEKEYNIDAYTRALKEDCEWYMLEFDKIKEKYSTTKEPPKKKRKTK